MARYLTSIGLLWIVIYFISSIFAGLTEKTNEVQQNHEQIRFILIAMACFSGGAAWKYVFNTPNTTNVEKGESAKQRAEVVS